MLAIRERFKTTELICKINERFEMGYFDNLEIKKKTVTFVGHIVKHTSMPNMHKGSLRNSPNRAGLFESCFYNLSSLYISRRTNIIST